MKNFISHGLILSDFPLHADPVSMQITSAEPADRWTVGYGLCKEGKYRRADNLFQQSIFFFTEISEHYQQGSLRQIEVKDLPAHSAHLRTRDMKKEKASSRVPFDTGETTQVSF